MFIDPNKHTFLISIRFYRLFIDKEVHQRNIEQQREQLQSYFTGRKGPAAPAVTRERKRELDESVVNRALGS